MILISLDLPSTQQEPLTLEQSGWKELEKDQRQKELTQLAVHLFSNEEV